MNRRSFLGGLAALVGGLAVEKAIPLGRVWSFPSKIVVPVQCAIKQYADYVSLSDLVLSSSLDFDDLDGCNDLAYRYTPYDFHRHTACTVC